MHSKFLTLHPLSAKFKRVQSTLECTIYTTKFQFKKKYNLDLWFHDKSSNGCMQPQNISLKKLVANKQFNYMVYTYFYLGLHFLHYICWNIYCCTYLFIYIHWSPEIFAIMLSQNCLHNWNFSLCKHKPPAIRSFRPTFSAL